MNRHFIKKMITASLFIIVLFTVLIQSWISAYNPIKETLQASDIHASSMKETIVNLENTINESVFSKFTWVEAYGYLQAVLDKNEFANFEVIKDKAGILHFTYFADGPKPTSELTDRMKHLQAFTKQRGIPLTYMMTPDKYVRGFTEFPQGIPYHYNNETADQLLAELKEAGIDTLDLREGILESGIAGDELFFRTDHHWKIETAFWGYTRLVQHFNKSFDMQLDPAGFYTNLENYNQIHYKNSYIGSMGRKTGKYYTVPDDFTFIYPKFKTDYDMSITYPDQVGRLHGRFEDALISTYQFNTDSQYENDKYFAYLFGNTSLVHIVNKDKPNGKKFLFIKDSFAVPLIAFLSTISSEIYLIDPRYYKDDILEFIGDKKLDHVIVSFSPPNLTDEFFKF